MVNLREKRETSIPSSSKKVGKTDFTIIAAAGGITRKRKDPDAAGRWMVSLIISTSRE
jgi:hypothetical protein